MVTIVKPAPVRQTHNLRIDLPAVYNSSISIISVDGSSSSPAGRLASANRSSDGSLMSAGSRIALFSVLCLHSYESKEESGLSFHKNEILQILETEDSGWWAARRKGNKDIGWIPRAYVARLEDDWVDRLENMREEIRCYEYNAEMLYSEAPTSRLGMLGSDTESTISRSSSLHATIPKRVRQVFC
jgi:son of sevenless